MISLTVVDHEYLSDCERGRRFVHLCGKKATNQTRLLSKLPYLRERLIDGGDLYLLGDGSGRARSREVEI